MIASEAAASVTSLSEIAPHAFVKHVDLHFRCGQLDERVGQGFYRTVHVAFDHEVELMEIVERAAASELFEAEAFLGAQAEFSLELFALSCDFACLLLRFKHVERVSCRRRAVEAENEHGSGWPGLLHPLVALVEHCLDFSVMRSGKYHVAHAERSVLHEHSGHIATSFVKARLYDGAYCGTVGIGLEVEHLGLKQHFLHKLVHSEAFLG